MPSTSPCPADERIQEAAALWFARLRGDEVSQADRADFAVWIEADERHRREYEILERMWDAAAPLRQCAARPARGRSARVAAGLAAIALLVGWLVLAPTGELLETGVGERRHLQLADGSELDMAPNTRLRVKFGWGKRRLELAEGRMAISVAVDRRRSLEVAAGGALIRDIGTRFEVSSAAGSASVTVVQGAVEVSLPAAAAMRRLGAGESVAFDEHGIAAPAAVDAAASLAWTQGQLVFDAARLDEVVAVLNRYRRTPIELADPALASIRISGVFLIDDDQAVLQALGAVAPVEFVGDAAKVEARVRRSR